MPVGEGAPLVWPEGVGAPEPTGIPHAVAHRSRTPKVGDWRGTTRSLYMASSATVPAVREEARRIAGRLEATLRVPDAEPRGIAVVTHPLPTHGGTMRNPLVAAIARACAERGLYALRFNFRGTEGSEGEFTSGREEARDLEAAVAEARSIAPGRPLLVAGFSFGALMILRWLAAGGAPDAYALLGVPLRGVTLATQALPPVPDGAFIVQGEHDQFGSAAELRAALPRARIVEIPGVDHFFVVRASVDASATGPSGALRDRYREVAAIVADELLRDARLAG